MGYFLVSFHLKHGSELARRHFCDEVERLGGVEALNAVYLVELPGIAQEVQQHLRKFLSPADSLLVVEFATAPEIVAPFTGTIAWLQERFSAAPA